MKKTSWLIRIWLSLWLASLFIGMSVSGTVQAQEADGYWELISVDVYERPAEGYSTFRISQGSGTFNAASEGDSFQASMSWTEPGQRYAAGQVIELTISVNIDEYNWYDDEPGYIHQGLNYLQANIYARIDAPEVGYSGVTREAIYFTDPQGEHNAQVETDYGKIAIGSQTLNVVAAFPSGGSDGDEKSIYIKCTAGMNTYNYRWVENSSAGLAPVPENEEPGTGTGTEWDPIAPTAMPEPGGLPVARVIVVVGVAIAGTMSAIAAELANQAAQAAASGKEEPPAEEIVYVLNPSHKRFDLKVDRPVTLTVNGYRVTQGGYQKEPGALISISLPPELAEFIQLQTTDSSGQVTCVITLLKIPSASMATLDIQGIFPHGKASAQVQLTFKMEFAIYPVRSPNITYHEKEKRWLAPELVACFRDPVQKTPVRVGYYYGFTDPPLTFEPDILEVKEGYSSDDGLTYNFKLNVRAGIDLEDYFGADLTDDDGRVTVNVVVKDEKGEAYAATTALQVSPKLRLVAYSYHQNVKTRGLRASPYEGLELDDMEFIADGIDQLPLVLFFIRSDKEVASGSEAEVVMDIVDVKKIDWITTTSFEEPAVNAANTGGGFFAYDLRSTNAITASQDTVNGEYCLEVDARIRPGGPKNYSIEGNSLRFAVKPQFTLLRLWVVPGSRRDTSEALAYVSLEPCRKPLPKKNLELSFECGEGVSLSLDGCDAVQSSTELDRTSSGGAFITKGSVLWTLRYSGLSWSSLPTATFTVRCAMQDKDGNATSVARSVSVNLLDNVNGMLEDMFNDAALGREINNSYWNSMPATIESYRGPLWNIYQNFSTTAPFVCYRMRDRIIGWLQDRRHYDNPSDPRRQIALMKRMNGLEFDYYASQPAHDWAGFFLSSMGKYGSYAALDPWWGQHWKNPDYKDYNKLRGKWGERARIYSMYAMVAVLAVALVKMLATYGIAVSLSAAISAISAWLAGASTVQILAILGISAGLDAVSYTADSDLTDGTGKYQGYNPNWPISFLKAIAQQEPAGEDL